MRIYWRLCEKQETLSYVTRWQNKDKIEIVKKCWKSFQESVKPNYSIVVVEDACSKELLDWMKSVSKTEDIIFTDGASTNPSAPNFVKLVEQIDNYTKAEPDRLHYCCSDDYLHVPFALDVVESVYRDGWQGFVLPYDYPDRYTIDRNKLCEVIVGSACHWRTVPSSTVVHVAYGKMWQQYMRELKQDAEFNSDAHTWRMFALTPAICPMPGVITHLAENCMTPRVNWQEVWDKIDV